MIVLSVLKCIIAIIFLERGAGVSRFFGLHKDVLIFFIFTRKKGNGSLIPAFL